MSSWVCIGTILKSHKTAGEFLCRLYSDLLLDKNGKHRLSDLQHIEIRKATKPAKKLELTELTPKITKPNETTLLLKCRQWEQPEEILPYHGWEIWVDRTYASPCSSDEFLYCDLIGALVYCKKKPGDKQNLGSVEKLIEGGAQLLLEIALPQKQHIYLPFHHTIIGEVDTSTNPPQIEVLSLEYFEALSKN